MRLEWLYEGSSVKSGERGIEAGYRGCSRDVEVWKRDDAVGKEEEDRPGYRWENWEINRGPRGANGGRRGVLRR